MKNVTFNDRSYQVDDDGFLLNFDDWDENFAAGTAVTMLMNGVLTKEHWQVIYFIRRIFKELGRCPLVYQTCKMNGLHLREFKILFPTGYLRGACKLAGLTFKEGYLQHSWLEESGVDIEVSEPEKTYSVDVRGFLVNPYDWDEQFAIYKAFEMKVPERLNRRHWQVLIFIRDYFKANKRIPTVIETCEGVGMDFDELEQLFPDGYQRGAVKIAGLRAKSKK
ncbi:MAG: TusE/DsrC/DsvC family sulfur relay protein [Candidatus Zixiibacteriota bacterium]